MSSVVKSKTKLPELPANPRILVVDDEPSLVELIGDVVSRDLGCTIVSAPTIAAAQKILSTQGIELLVADLNLPDGNGMSLLQTLKDTQPAASAIVITGAPTMDGAISAMRSGAVDFLPKPFTGTQLAQRVRKALTHQAAIVRQERRIEKLRLAVRKLNEARRLIGKKVDLLCNDLVSAYGELSRQVDGLRNQESFRKTVDKATDLEQLLCHAMDWLLRQIGYSNIGVWLATEDGDFQLGAYMKYTVAGEPGITDALKQSVLPLAAREGTLVHLQPEELTAALGNLPPAEAKLFKGQDLIALNCTYLGDALAAIVFFRDARSPFTADDETLLRTVGPVFATSLASVVKAADGGSDDEDSDEEGTDPAAPFLENAADSDTDVPFEDEPEKAKPQQKRKPKVDPSDWWKRGEQPPF